MHDDLMRKTETMNVLVETNKMLRAEKERLEQELQQMQAKASTSIHCLPHCMGYFGFTPTKAAREHETWSFEIVSCIAH